MDDIQKDKRRKAKADCIAWLSEEGRDAVRAHDLFAIDERLDEYVATVLAYPEGRNLFELLALERFIRFLDIYDLDVAKVRHVLKVLGSLKFVTERGMQHLKLSSVQVFGLTNIYGFRRVDGRRLVRNAMFFVPRKFGKTTISAGLATYELLFGDADGQVYACANSYQQAKLCFDNIRYTTRALDPSGRSFKINREVIFNNREGRNNFARCLAADASTLDGLNASVYILDEYAQAKSAELRNVMATSTGTRANPLEIIITTASDVVDGPCASTLEAYKRVLMSEQEDDSIFALIFEPDVDDKEDDPQTWRKVQPHIGLTIKEDYYETMWQKALLTSEDMLAFRNKLLNVFAVNEQKSWITSEEIRDLSVAFDIEAVQGRPYCMVSFDLSVWDDFSCVAYAIYQNNKFHFHHEFYLPEVTLEKHTNKELYRKWAEDGYLRVLPGNTIDYALIANDILKRAKNVYIIGIAYDPYKSREAVNILTASGGAAVLKGYKQTYANFTGPVETLELLIKRKGCSFTDNPITPWCYGNAMMDEDRMGNKKPTKRSASGKIDCTVTDLMCLGLFSTVNR